MKIKCLHPIIVLLPASGSRYYGSVTVALDTVVVNQEGHSQEGQAVESAYRKLAEDFGLDTIEPG